MRINLEHPEVQKREERLNSISGFAGTARELCDKSNSGRLCDKKRSFSQCLGCSSGNAICQSIMIQDTVTINHAPLGCAGDFADFNFTNRVNRGFRNLEIKNCRAISTNLEEKDTIYGGGEKLRKTIELAYERYNPKAIFVTASCASGIIGDDIESITNEAEEKLGIPVAYISCEGFRSKLWTTGFDATFHGILRKVVKPPVKKQDDLINVINFWGSDIFTDLFKRLNLRPNYIVPFSTIEQLEKISEATATVQICPTLGTYLAAGLEQEYGVKEVKAPVPYGLKGTDNWFRELGKITGKEKEVEELIAKEKEKIAPKLKELREKLKGKRAYVTAGAAHGHSIIALLKELGLEVTGAGIFHHDPKYDCDGGARNKCCNGSTESLNHVVNTYGDVPNFHVCNKQAFELVNNLNRIKPDLLIARHGGVSVWGIKLGIPTLLVGDEQFGLGYQGIINYGEKILQILNTKEFSENIASHSLSPYSDWWLSQPANKFIGGK
ncbi:nitrogenase [Clostridium bornimense]|uniref:Nitrogenase n=1 Tax=Clostridium bornimense TaxID=1216932 RepID=W6RSC1_9CLOT|nr:nitrogenase component 1 [Clostridium bornimense]CDM67471.1 nitrogenase [Clostridium bornimense]